MKQMMNEVNPKAGTLKPRNRKTLQNVSRKLIAFVLMLAIALQPAVLSAKTLDYKGDTCCSVEKKNTVNKFAKLVKVNLPSRDYIRKADSEITRNLYNSMEENRVKQFADGFATSDAEINRAFNAENRISAPKTRLGDDEWMAARFMAENIQMPANWSANDATVIKDFNQSVRIQWATPRAEGLDEMVTLQFFAENISIPSAEMITVADESMHHRIMQELNNSILAIK